MRDNHFAVCQRAAIRQEAELYCHLVGTGKPVASIMCPRPLLRDVDEICQHQGCSTFVEPCRECPEWCLVFIYNVPVMLDVIKYSLRLTDASPFEVWVRGCMYGYSLSAIEEAAMWTRTASSGRTM